MHFLTSSFRILNEYYKNPDRNLKLVLSRELDKTRKSGRQGITRTVYGVIRKERQIDHIIQNVSKRKLKKIQPNVLLFLRIGVFLLVYSGSYPDYAVVKEVVEAVGGNARGFVNALLRNVIKNKADILAQLEKTAPLDIKYSISNVLIDNLSLISDSPEEHLDYLNREPLFHLRVNTHAFSYGEAKQLLIENKTPFKELEKFSSFEIKEAGRIINRLLEQKQFYFQNTGSQLVSIIASKFSRAAVLDGCAAPGTKSVTLSMLNPGLTVFANDINFSRLKLLDEFLTGYGLTTVKPVVSDIKHFGYKNNFDFIMVDAPCTSSGTLRKNPDLKLKIDNALAVKNAKEQYEIMKTLLGCFSNTGAAGATVLYSVCSFLKAETEEIMERLLKTDRVPGSERFEMIPLDGILEEYGFKYKKADYGYYLLPDDTLNNDMFYLCGGRISQ